MTDRFLARYTLQTAADADIVANVIAGEQSSGTFVEIPGEDFALKQRSAARIEGIEPVEAIADSPLPGTVPQGQPRSFQLTLSWPMESIGPSLPNLLATVAGNLFELKNVAGLKIEDIILPDDFVAAYPGPAFGVEGTRRLTGVEDRPLIGTIVKPSVGLRAEGTAELVAALCEGGIDFIKDDELQSDGTLCPFDDRVDAVMRVINTYADATGKKPMFAFNLTGELDQMRRRHDRLVDAGGTCAMVSLNSIGLVGLSELRRHARIPIHAHRNGWGYLGRSPNNGWSYVAWQKIWRIAGVDHMHVNGLSNKFWEPDESVILSALNCLSPITNANPCIVMPIFSSGQTVMQVAETWRRLHSPDLIYCAGGGVVAHPSGIAAGVRSLREAWDAAMSGIPLDQAARSSRELGEAVEKFR